MHLDLNPINPMGSEVVEEEEEEEEDISHPLVGTAKHLDLNPNNPLGSEVEEVEEEEEEEEGGGISHPSVGTANHLDLNPDNSVESTEEEDTQPSLVGTGSHLDLYPNDPLESSSPNDAGSTTTTITDTNDVNPASNTNFVVQGIEDSPVASVNFVWYSCIAAALFLIVAILCRRTYINSRRRYRNRKRQNTLLNLFHYLKPFEVEDIDVKSSATGGFHCTYLGNIAEGGDVRDDASTGTSSTGSYNRPSLLSSPSLNGGNRRRV